MKTLALLALGAFTLTACDFAGSAPEMSNLGVNQIEVSGLTLPAAADDGDGRADVFIEIQNHTGQTIWRSQRFDNADPAQTFNVRVSESVMVASRTQDLSVAVWDYDTSITDSQLIARSVRFQPQAVTPAPMALSAATGTGSFVLNAASE